MKNLKTLFGFILVLSMMISCMNNERNRSEDIEMMDSRDTLFNNDRDIHDSISRDSMLRDSLPTQPIKY